MKYVPRSYTFEQRVAHYTAPANKRGCRLWVGNKSEDGYGLLWWEGRRRYVNQTILVRKLGRPLKPGHFALHHCDTPACTTTRHLYEGTKRQNALDCVARGRHARHGNRGEAGGGAKLTVAKIQAIRASSQSCAELGNQFGVCPMQISRIKRRQQWAHVP